MEQEKHCKKHGITSFILEARGYFRCKKCRKDAVVRRRKKLKVLAVEYKGGKCEKCGYSKCITALEFHHFDTNKEFGISANGYTRSWKSLKEELDKCMMVCANCHRELHNGDNGD